MDNVKILNEVFKEKTGIDFNSKESLKNVNLFSDKINLQPRDLVTVCISIEKIFDIKFDEKEFLDRKFDTFNKIVELIKKYCEKKGRKNSR